MSKNNRNNQHNQNQYDNKKVNHETYEKGGCDCGDAKNQQRNNQETQHGDGCDCGCESCK